MSEICQNNTDRMAPILFLPERMGAAVIAKIRDLGRIAVFFFQGIVYMGLDHQLNQYPKL